MTMADVDRVRRVKELYKHFGAQRNLLLVASVIVLVCSVLHARGFDSQTERWHHDDMALSASDGLYIFAGFLPHANLLTAWLLSYEMMREPRIHNLASYFIVHFITLLYMLGYLLHGVVLWSLCNDKQDGVALYPQCINVDYPRSLHPNFTFLFRFAAAAGNFFVAFALYVLMNQFCSIVVDLKKAPRQPPPPPPPLQEKQENESTNQTEEQDGGEDDEKSRAKKPKTD